MVSYGMVWYISKWVGILCSEVELVGCGYIGGNFEKGRSADIYPGGW